MTEKIHPRTILFEQIVGGSDDFQKFMEFETSTYQQDRPQSQLASDKIRRLTLSQRVAAGFSRDNWERQSHLEQLGDILFQALITWVEKTLSHTEIESFPENWQQQLAEKVSTLLSIMNDPGETTTEKRDLMYREIATQLDSWIGLADPRSLARRQGEFPNKAFIRDFSEKLKDSISKYLHQPDNPDSEKRYPHEVSLFCTSMIKRASELMSNQPFGKSNLDDAREEWRESSFPDLKKRAEVAKNKEKLREIRVSLATASELVQDDLHLQQQIQDVLESIDLFVEIGNVPFYEQRLKNLETEIEEIFRSLVANPSTPQEHMTWERQEKRLSEIRDSLRKMKVSVGSHTFDAVDPDLALKLLDKYFNRHFVPDGSFSFQDRTTWPK